MSASGLDSIVPPLEMNPSLTTGQVRGGVGKTACLGRRMRARARQMSSKALSETSTDGDAFHPKLKRRRQHQRSFSSIGNKSITKPDVVKADAQVRGLDQQARENLVLDIIDREISEWQRECYSGRPAWWSPASKWEVVGQNPSNRRLLLRGTPLWSQNIKEHSLLQCCDSTRRAVTDSYLLNYEDRQELAHFIAVQLLGACFTLSPDYLSRYRAPEYRSLSALNPADLPDTGLISSLRMHSTFRYSPSFGHQAQNTSPISHWFGAYDGPSLSTANERSAQQYTTDESETDRPTRKRRNYESLGTNQRFGAEPAESIEKREQVYLPNAAVQPETIWQRRNARRATNGRSLSMHAEKDSRTHPSSPVNEKHHHSSPRSPFPSPTSRSENYLEPLLETSGFSSRSGLPPSIRSDSRPIPPQQRATVHWQAFRGLFGHSEGSGSHALSLQSGNATNTSRSPLLSPNARERRRQARERHDIHSSSTETESSPHYNTPASGLRSGLHSPSFLSSQGSPMPRFEDRDPLVMAATIASSRIPPSQSNSAPTSPYDTSPAPPNNSRASPAVSPTLDFPDRTKPDFLPLTGEVRALVSRSFSPRRKETRSQRRSMLSEVHTPDDIGLEDDVERDGVNVFGSALSSPTEEISSWDVSDEKIPLLSHTSRQRPKLEERVVSSPGIGSTDSIPEAAMSRRKIRLSSTGTAIYRPSEDMVESEGLARHPQTES